jgi:lysophospholipase L1-like esterase
VRKLSKTALVVAWNFIFVFVLLGAAELAARAIQLHRLGPNSQNPRELRDRYAEWRNNPVFSDSFVHHNSQGFRRDAETPPAKPANTIRVFVLGASVAYGQGGMYSDIDDRPPPRNNETIDYYLEHELNARFPSRHWEAINAGVRGYRLHQDLARLLSLVLRFQPDYVVSIDGRNDIDAILENPSQADPYLTRELDPDFERLANPASFGSIRVFASMWLRNDSVLYRTIHEWMAKRTQMRYFNRKLITGRLRNPVRWEDLTPAEQSRYRLSACQLDAYIHEVRQIHAILAVDRIPDLFVLQPELVLTRKPLVGTEPRLDEMTRRREGNLSMYGFATLYPKLARQLAADAPARGYRFADLTGAFDGADGQTFTDFCHLTPYGNRMVAERIFESLADSFHER